MVGWGTAVMWSVPDIFVIWFYIFGYKGFSCLNSLNCSYDNILYFA